MEFFSSWPIPPAPTTPSTVEARTLNSHQKSPIETMLGATSGTSANDEHLQSRGARDGRRLERPRRDVLDHLGPELGGAPPGVQRDAQDARERPEADGGDEEEREHERVDAPQRIQEPARRIVEEHARRDIARGHHARAAAPARPRPWCRWPPSPPSPPAARAARAIRPVAGGHAFTAHEAILGSPVRSLPGSTCASCQLTDVEGGDGEQDQDEPHPARGEPRARPAPGMSPVRRCAITSS